MYQVAVGQHDIDQMQEPQGVYLEGDGFGDEEDYGDEGDEEPVLAIEN